jgi:hypothetical protein
MVILITSILFATRDLQTLILNPIDRIIARIRLIADNPLLMMKRNSAENGQVGEAEINETLFIEEAINKITRLLVLGFG